VLGKQAIKNGDNFRLCQIGDGDRLRKRTGVDRAATVKIDQNVPTSAFRDRNGVTTRVGTPPMDRSSMLTG